MREIDDPDESLEIEQIEADSYSGPLVFGGDEVDNTLEAKIKLLAEVQPESELVKGVEEFRVALEREDQEQYEIEKRDLIRDFRGLGITYTNVFVRGFTARETPETVRERYGDLTVRARGLELGDSLSCWDSLAMGLNIKRKNPAEELINYFEKATGIQPGQPEQPSALKLFISQVGNHQYMYGQAAIFLAVTFDLENDPGRLISLRDYLLAPTNSQKISNEKGIIELSLLLPVFNEWFHQSPLEAK